MVTVSTVSPTPRARYDAKSGRGVSGKVIAVFAVAMVLLIVVMVGRAIYQDRSRPVTAEFISQERLDDETARLWVDINRKDTSKDSYCVVYAVDYEHAEIGRREVVIPAGGEALQRVAVEMPTREPIASGRVYGCAQDIPSYMNTQETYLQAR